MATRTDPALLRARVDRASDVGTTRDALRRRLGSLDWQERSLDTAVLVASELMTNGLQHAGPPVDVEVAPCDGTSLSMQAGSTEGIRIAVHDRSSDGPQMRERGDEHGGYGMRLVARAAEAWGWYADDVGKVVWADVVNTRNGA